MAKLIGALGKPISTALVEVAKLDRTLAKRRDDILAFFDYQGSSNGPTEAINRRLEHLRGTVLEFRNPTHYIARSLLEVGGFRPALHPRIVKSRATPDLENLPTFNSMSTTNVALGHLGARHWLKADKRGSECLTSFLEHRRTHSINPDAPR